MIKKRTNFFEVITLFPLLLSAQEISKGKVVDAETNIPLVGVIVSVKDGIDHQTLFFDTTDINGSFTLKTRTEQNHLIQFQKLGYEKKTTSLQKIDKVIALKKKEEKIVVLEEVEVNDQRSYFGANNNKVVLEAKNYRDSINTRLENLLDNIPGIFVDYNNGDIYYRNVRIETVLLDGSNITSNNYQQLTQNLDQGIADSIEIIADYSDNTVLESFESSQDVAINVITDKKYQKNISGKTSAAYGLDGWYQADINTLFNDKNIKLLANAAKQNVGLELRAINRSNTTYHKNLSLSDYDLNLQSPLSPLGYEQSVLGFLDLGVINNLTNYKIAPDFYTKINKNQSLLINYNNSRFDGKNRNMTNYYPLSDLFDRISNSFTNSYKDLLNRFDFQYDAVFNKKVQLRTYYVHQSTLQESLTTGLLNNENFQKKDSTRNVYFDLGLSLSARLGRKHALAAVYREMGDKQSEFINRNADNVFPSFDLNQLMSTHQIFQNRNNRNKTRYAAVNYAYKINVNSLFYISYFNNSMIQYDAYSNTSDKSRSFNSTKNQLYTHSFQLQWKYASKNFNTHIGLTKTTITWKKWRDSKLFPSILVNFSDNISWNINANYRRYLILSPLKQQTALNVYSHSFLINQQLYEFDIPAFGDQFSLNLSKVWPYSMQNTSILFSQKTVYHNYIKSLRRLDEFILQQNQVGNNNRKHVVVVVKHNKYFRKIRSSTEVVFSRINNRFTHLINGEQWNNNITKNEFSLTYKSFFKSFLNLIASINYSQNDYKQYSNQKIFQGNWNSFSLRKIIKIRVIPKVMDMRFENIYFEYNNSSINMLNCSFTWKSLIKKTDAKIMVYNLLNQRKLQAESFQSNYLVSENQPINNRAVLLVLHYNF